VMNGDNLIHSIYLQTLSSWAVNLGIDNILYNVAQPLHLLSIEGQLVPYFYAHNSFCIFTFLKACASMFVYYIKTKYILKRFSLSIPF